MRRKLMAIFKHQSKKQDVDIKVNLSRKKSILQSLLNILVLNLTKVWTGNIILILLQSNRIEQMLLFKFKNSVNSNTLKAIYSAIFYSRIDYTNLIWAQNWNALNRIFTFQKRRLEWSIFNHGIVIQVFYSGT